VIEVACRGRLGNQMFQYAFGVAAARRLGTSFAFDARELEPLFALGLHAAPDGRERPVVAVGNDDYDDPAAVLAQVADETQYVGWFQSELFFADVAAEIRAAFCLRGAQRERFTDSYGDLAGRPYVCCHLRRTDYHTFAGGAALPMRYYEDALERLGPPAGTPVVFVGDDLEEAVRAFGTLPGARFEHNDAAVDFQLVTDASAVVVSNSTFAWWGAWLNARARDGVIAPRHWIGFTFGWEYPPCVVPRRWTQIAVRRPWRKRLAPSAVRTTLAGLRRGRRPLRRAG
jgi:hypothetical protein